MSVVNPPALIFFLNERVLCELTEWSVVSSFFYDVVNGILAALPA